MGCFYFFLGGGWLVQIFGIFVEVGRLLTQNIDLLDVWWIFSATLWICNWRVFGCAPEKGTISKGKASLPSSIFHGMSITLDHGVTPRYSLPRLWRYVAPSLLMLLSCWMQRMVSLVHWPQLRFDGFHPLHSDASFQLPTPWLMVTDLHLWPRITTEVNRAQTGLPCGCGGDQLSLGRKKRMETGDIWETTLGLGCWIFVVVDILFRFVW